MNKEQAERAKKLKEVKRHSKELKELKESVSRYEEEVNEPLRKSLGK